MYESPFDIAQLLERVLSRFSEVVSFSEGTSWWKNDIDFYDLFESRGEISVKAKKSFERR